MKKKREKQNQKQQKAWNSWMNWIFVKSVIDHHQLNPITDYICVCIYVFSQKFLLVGLAVIAAVNADISHLLGGGSGPYNYPQPAPSFQEQLSLPIAPAPAPAVRISLSKL